MSNSTKTIKLRKTNTIRFKLKILNSYKNNLICKLESFTNIDSSLYYEILSKLRETEKNIVELKETYPEHLL